MRLLAAVENQPQAIRGTGETRREAGNGKEHGWQQPRAMASEPESSHVDSTAKRRIRLARALVVSCRPKGITNSNRRIRNRTYGGVGGADERLSPLSRSRVSAPRHFFSRNFHKICRRIPSTSGASREVSRMRRMNRRTFNSIEAATIRLV